MSDIINCPSCGKENETDRRICKYCGVSFTPEWFGRNISLLFIQGVRIIGWIYFLISIVGSIILFTAAKSVEVEVYSVTRTTNYFFIVAGIANILVSTIVLLICFTLARIYEQNVYIIRHLRNE